MVNDYPAVIEVLKLAEENKRLRAVISAMQAPTFSAKLCELCGETEAFTGRCGGGQKNPRALCFEAPSESNDATGT